MAKGLIIALVALALVCVGLGLLAVNFYMGKQNEALMRQSLEQRLQDIEKARADLEKELSETKQLKADAEKRAQGLEDQSKTILVQLDQSKKNEQAVLEQIAKKEKEFQDTRMESELIKTSKADLENKLKVAQDYYVQLEDQIARLKKEKSTLESKLENFSLGSSVSLEKIVVKADSSSETLSGKVKVVNREFDFVVVDVGNNQGVKAGMVFAVRRAGELIGRLEAEKIYADMTAATITFKAPTQQIQEGDDVILEK